MEQIAANGKQRLVIVTVSVLILIIAIVVILRGVSGPAIPKLTKQAWFYDLNTGKLFAAPFDAIPPIPAPSGLLPNGSPAGVLAYVFGCVSCAERNRIIVYLETRTPEAQAKLIALRQLPPGTDPPEQLRSFQQWDGLLYKRPSDAEWVARESDEGYQIHNELAIHLCPAKQAPQPCYPDGR